MALRTFFESLYSQGVSCYEGYFGGSKDAAIVDREGKLIHREGREVYWSNAERIPYIGDTITVKMNGLGPAVVTGYWLEGDCPFIGLIVSLLEPPEWWIKQNGTEPKHSYVTGREVKINRSGV